MSVSESRITAETRNSRVETIKRSPLTAVPGEQTTPFCRSNAAGRSSYSQSYSHWVCCPDTGALAEYRERVPCHRGGVIFPGRGKFGFASGGERFNLGAVESSLRFSPSHHAAMPTSEPGEIKTIPSNFQKRMLWGAITGLSITLIGAITVGVVLLGGTILSYLQPILVPLAVAGIIAYLLDPIVSWLQERGISHRVSSLSVYVVFLLLVILLVVAVFVPTFGQAREAYAKRDAYGEQVTRLVKKGFVSLQNQFDTGIAEDYYQQGIEWVAEEGPKIGANIGQWLWSRVRGAFGFLVIYLGCCWCPFTCIISSKTAMT